MLVSMHLSNLFQDASRTKGIPGWDTVGQCFDKPKRSQCVKCRWHAHNIIQLYNNLDDYDKRPLVYNSIMRRPATGRFGHKNKRKGHIGVVAMKRCFLSAGNCNVFATFGLHDAALSVVYHQMYKCPIHHVLAAVILVYLPLDVYIFYSSLTSTFVLQQSLALAKIVPPKPSPNETFDQAEFLWVTRQ